MQAPYRAEAVRERPIFNQRFCALRYCQSAYDPGMTTPPPPPGEAGPVQPVQKSKAGPVIAIIGVILLVLCVGCAGGAWYFYSKAKKTVEDVVNNLPSTFPTNDDAKAPQNTTHTVRYEVNGSGMVQIIYT